MKTSTIHIELLFRNAPVKSSWSDLSLVWFAGATPEIPGDFYMYLKPCAWYHDETLSQTTPDNWNGKWRNASQWKGLRAIECARGPAIGPLVPLMEVFLKFSVVRHSAKVLISQARRCIQEKKVLLASHFSWTKFSTKARNLKRSFRNFLQKCSRNLPWTGKSCFGNLALVKTIFEAPKCL